MKLSEFDFTLPENLIAQHPSEERSSSRLFFYDRETGENTHGQFTDILGFFGPDDVLVFNDSRVLPARIRLEHQEIFLAEPVLEYDSHFLSAKTWKCLVRKGKHFPMGRKINFPDGTIAEVERIEENGLRQIRFDTEDFSRFLEQHGEVPLPPYIHEKLSDPERYQTVYSEEKGSVAAPTAGLHFTPQILEEFRAKGVQIEFITLHVGLGTFSPVKTEQIKDHEMHSEFFSISEETAEKLNAAKKNGKKITAVGTTSLRTLESSARSQLSAAQTSQLQTLSGKTDIFLFPPAPFLFVDHLFTNFHLPKSTLLMLVAAFLSPEKIDGIEKAQELYQEAIREKYRFFSFGDAMLIF